MSGRLSTHPADGWEAWRANPPFVCPSRTDRLIHRDRRCDAVTRGRVIVDRHPVPEQADDEEAAHDDGQRHSPCSVREQPATPAESNQERGGSIEKFSDVTGASRSLSLPQAGFPSPACGARADLGHYSDTRGDLSQGERANTWTFQRARPDSNGGPAGSKPVRDRGRGRGLTGVCEWPGGVVPRRRFTLLRRRSITFDGQPAPRPAPAGGEASSERSCSKQ
jgi:hypothetical protein